MSGPLWMCSSLAAVLFVMAECGPLCGQDSAIGLTEIELQAYRQAPSFAWYAKHPPVSKLAGGVIFNQAVIQLYAPIEGKWLYRGSVRALSSVEVEKDDFAKMRAVLESAEYRALLNCINGNAYFSAEAAKSDLTVYYLKTKQTLRAIDGLNLSTGDKALFERIIGEGLLDHPMGSRHDLIPKGLRDKRLDDLFDRSKNERESDFKKLHLKPRDISVADPVILRAIPGQLEHLTTKPDHVLNLRQMTGSKNVIQLDLGTGDRLLMTVKPDAVSKTLSGVKASELPALLKGEDVEHFHVESLGRGIVRVPKENVRIGPPK